MEEFGDPSLDDLLEQDQAQDTECQSIHSHSPEAPMTISLEEFPWATGIGSMLDLRLVGNRFYESERLT